MKKTMLLAVLFMFVLTSVCMASLPNGNNLELIGSNDEMSIFYDKSTIRHYDGGAFCNVDIVVEFYGQNKTMVMNNEYSKGMEVRVLSIEEYDTHTGELLHAEEDPNAAWHDITAGSLFEVIWNCVI